MRSPTLLTGEPKYMIFTQKNFTPLPDLDANQHTATSANIMTVTVDTNCPMGGDGGHGGKTRFVLKNDACTSWEINGDDSYEELEIVLYGDTECDTFIECLEFAVKTLQAQRYANSISRQA